MTRITHAPSTAHPSRAPSGNSCSSSTAPRFRHQHDDVFRRSEARE